MLRPNARPTRHRQRGGSAARRTTARLLTLVTVTGLLATACGATHQAGHTPAATARSGSPGGSVSTRPGTPTASPSASAGGDAFVPAKLKPGEKPPQFIVVSFDGAGWHEKWQYWQGIADHVPFRFTGFLTGLYLLDDAHQNAYQGSGHGEGRTSLGSWNSPAEVRQEILDLNAAYKRGDEIGTHFNAHFCADNRPGANDWSTADWNDELDQFFRFVKDYRSVDDNPGLPTLDVPASSIRAERTPCLEGHPSDLFPALVGHHFDVDSSVTRSGLSWPVRKDGLWQLGMPVWPVHGTGHLQIMMDYNFYYSQEGARSAPTRAKSAEDSAQTLATYQDMYDAAYRGNRAPLILGNHFEGWNNNAYTDALGTFVQRNFGKPGTLCVPFKDLVAWLQAQNPATLAKLQALPAETGR